MKVKNILNCFLHFFLFRSCTGTILLDLIRILLASFTESDIEILIFILHNIGIQLRKEDPGAIKEIIDMAQSKKNNYIVELKMAEAAGKDAEEL
jgi:nucleolar MIF4G domain-containing protein 1